MTKFKILILTFLSILMLFSFMPSIESNQVKKIHNTLDEIKACEGRIKLNLIREWGGEGTTDENKIFYEPKDIKIGKDGLVYILDSKNNRIQTFDSSGNYKSTIGRRGEGPGEFSTPMGLALDNQNNIVVSDFTSSKIQIINPIKGYINGYKCMRPGAIAITSKNEIVVDDYRKTYESSFLLTLYNHQGNIVREIGRHINYGPSRPRLPQSLDHIYFDLDKYDNFYIAYGLTPYLEKYSSKNESLMSVTFEMPFKVPKVQVTISGGNIKVISEKVSSGLSVDNQGRIYLVVTTRPVMQKEKIRSAVSSSRRKSSSRTARKGKAIDSETTDLYRLLIFDHSGMIIGTKRLNVFCDKIYVHGDRLFIVDTRQTMKIYEYKISFE